MSQSLVRSRSLITHVLDRHSWNEIADGAVLQDGGVIVAVGTFSELKRKHPSIPVIGSGREILLPGFVNSHHHIGLTPVQLGSLDMPLELWFVTRMISRMVSPYLDTLYAAFEMVASGITTVQHIMGGLPGTLSQVELRVDEVIRAYENIGMRASCSLGLRDQNLLVYEPNNDFISRLPIELRAPTQRWFDRIKMNLDDHISLFENLHGRYQSKRRIKIQLAPANLHWCSDNALTRLSETSEKYGVPLHMHLLETPYQKEYGQRRGNCSPLEYIHRFNLLGPKMTLGHAAWVSERDIELLANTGTCVCHCCSSSLRLRSGLLPLNRLEACGINMAIGMDEAGINDDHDILSEMRLALRAHRVPSMHDDMVPTSSQLFRMATAGGALTTPYGEQVGTLQVGKAADMVLMDWHQISFPYLDENISLLDAVLLRAKTSGVRTVICDGEVIYDDGKFMLIDRDAALQELHEELKKPFAEDEKERRTLSEALVPHVKAFYAGYYDSQKHDPFYKMSSRT
jgi:5-methylthioadenosine/S-adenosylhomocysteine deaminase